MDSLLDSGAPEGLPIPPLFILCLSCSIDLDSVDELWVYVYTSIDRELDGLYHAALSALDDNTDGSHPFMRS